MQFLNEQTAERQFMPAQFAQIGSGFYRKWIGNAQLQWPNGGQPQRHDFFQIERGMAKERHAFANIAGFEEVQQGFL